MASAASRSVTIGAAPVAQDAGTVIRMRTVPLRMGTASSTWSSSTLRRVAPVGAWVASRSSSPCQASRSPRRHTGLVVSRDAQRRSGAASSTPIAPDGEVPWRSERRRPATSAGSAPAAISSSSTARSKRPSSSPTGSSTRSIPATATGPGMMLTAPAGYRASCACHSESERHHRRTSASMTGTKLTGLPGVRHWATKNGTSAGCSTAIAASGYRADSAAMADVGRSSDAGSANNVAISPRSAAARRASARCSIAPNRDRHVWSSQTDGTSSPRSVPCSSAEPVASSTYRINHSR